MALALGGRTVKELEAVLDSDELTEWAAYYQLDPFGGIRGDYQAAIITSNLMNAQIGEKKTKVSDFLPQFGPPTLSPRMSAMAMRERLRTMFNRPPRSGHV